MGLALRVGKKKSGRKTWDGWRVFFFIFIYFTFLCPREKTSGYRLSVPHDGALLVYFSTKNVRVLFVVLCLCVSVHLVGIGCSADHFTHALLIIANTETRRLDRKRVLVCMSLYGCIALHVAGRLGRGIRRGKKEGRTMEGKDKLRLSIRTNIYASCMFLVGWLQDPY